MSYNLQYCAAVKTIDVTGHLQTNVIDYYSDFFLKCIFYIDLKFYIFCEKCFIICLTRTTLFESWKRLESQVA